MSRTGYILRGIVIFSLLFTGAHAEVQERDIRFQELDLHKVIESLAKLQGKSVMFSRNVERTPVTVNLGQVTPAFALKLILENFGYIAVAKGDVLHIMTPAERGVASSTPTTVIPLTNVIARDIIENVRTLTGTGANIIVSTNDQLNAILVSAPDDILSRIKRIVTELDQESAQVYIEAKLVEASTSFSRSLGIQWGNSNGNGGIDRTSGFSVDAPAQTQTLVGVLGAAGLDARITAGETNGDVKVISSPKITTLNGTAANIESIETFSIRTLTGVAGAGQAAAANGGIQSVRAGVRLQVTPFIVSQDQVRLNIQLSKSDPNFSRLIDGIPGISDNTANTSLIVRNGQTASIGGLIRHSDAYNTTGAPFFAKLPIVGFLFGSSEKTKDSKELLIFITPTVFRGSRSTTWGKAEVQSDVAFDGMQPLRNTTADPQGAPATPATTPPAAPVAPSTQVSPAAPTQGGVVALPNVAPATPPPTSAPATSAAPVQPQENR